MDEKAKKRLLGEPGAWPREARGRGLKGDSSPPRSGDMGSLWQLTTKAGGQNVPSVRDGQCRHRRNEQQESQTALEMFDGCVILATGTLCCELRAHHEWGPEPNIVLR